MSKVTSLSGRRRLPTDALPQPGNVITAQQAIARGITPEQLRAVANWNERKSHNERRRRARGRLKSQAGELRAVAAQLERGGMREAA